MNKSLHVELLIANFEQDHDQQHYFDHPLFQSPFNLLSSFSPSSNTTSTSRHEVSLFAEAICVCLSSTLSVVPMPPFPFFQ